MIQSFIDASDMSVSHRNFFNNLADEWDTLVEDNPDLEKYMKQFGVNRGDRVLDVGAGTGRLTAMLSKMVGPDGLVVAVDFSEKMLSIAKERLNSNNVRFICADACTLSLADQSFTKVICFSTFPHIIDKKNALQEFYRVLSVGGKCLILHTCSSDKLNSFHASLNGIVRHDTLPSAKSLALLLKSLNFSVNFFERSDLFWVEGEKPY